MQKILVFARVEGGYVALWGVESKTFENKEQLHSWLGRLEARSVAVDGEIGNLEGFWRVPASIEITIN